jgi:hypothetical protein
MRASIPGAAKQVVASKTVLGATSGLAATTGPPLIGGARPAAAAAATAAAIAPKGAATDETKERGVVARAATAAAPTPREAARETPRVVAVAIKRVGLNCVEEMRELFGIDQLPLLNADVAIEVKGASIALINAIRRTVTDEMAGHCLSVPPAGGDAAAGEGYSIAESTDKFMISQFVSKRIALMPLRPAIPPEVVDALRLDLDVTNAGPVVRTVYSADLKIVAGPKLHEPLFNPTFELASLQPGKRLVVRGIRIVSGFARDGDAAFQVAARAAYSFLDIPQHDVKETHTPGGGAADLSGYKVSCLVAAPRHFRLTAVVPAAPPNAAEVRGVFAAACANISGRLRLVANAITSKGAPVAAPASGAGTRGIQFSVVRLDAALEEATLEVPGESYTIGTLLRHYTFELAPDIVNQGVRMTPDRNRMIFTLRHTADVTALILDAIRTADVDLDTLRRGILDAPGN